MSDVPTLTDEDTANYAVLNPLDAGTLGITVSNANLNFAVLSASWTAIRASIGVSSGKWYWEITPLTAPVNDYFMNGIKDVTESIPAGTSQYVGTTSGSYGYYGLSGNKYNNSSFAAYGAAYGVGDVIGVALDMDAGTLTFYKNNVSQGVAYSGLTGIYAPALSMQGSSGNTNTEAINFGQRPFAYTPPTGYKKLNTFNLPDSSIVDSSEYFNTVLYNGAVGNSPQSITGVGFEPDFVWLKERSSTSAHFLNQANDGTVRFMQSNTTNAEVTDAQVVGSFDSDGFSVGNSGGSNQSGQTYVAWNWKANGAGVSNTDGTITSQVSANPTAGFSVVTWTGTGATATVGHGLGVVPKLYITKDRTNSSTNWHYHTTQIDGGMDFLFLNTTSTSTSSSLSTPSSTVITVGGTINTSSANFVSYVFADVEGYSKFGSYTGNGSADGTFVYTGFRPAYVMIKRTNATNFWYIYDTKRDAYNVMDSTLYANISDGEATASIILDSVSNGFKLRTALDGFNLSGGPYIYMAFAENPFKNSLAR